MCTMVLGLLSAGISAMGSIQQGQAAKQEANYRARVAEVNAKTAEYKARDAIVRGKLEQRKVMSNTAEVRGRQTAAWAASGLDVAHGSVLQASIDTAALGEMDKLVTQSNSYREAYEQKIAATNYENQATFARMEGKNAAKAGYLNAAGSILTGVGKAFGTYRSGTTFT